MSGVVMPSPEGATQIGHRAGRDVVGRAVIGVERVVGQDREGADLVFGDGAGIVHRDRHVVDAVDGDDEVGARGLAGIAGQRVGHGDRGVFAERELLEVCIDQRNLNLVADDGRRRIGIDEGLAGRAGDGDAAGADRDRVQGGMVGILGVVGDDIERGRCVILGHGAGVGDRQRQIVGAMDGNGQRCGVLQAAGVLDGVVELVGDGFG